MPKYEEAHRRSPPRGSVAAVGAATSSRTAGTDPEAFRDFRTLELAIDQSITARNLLYHPNESCLAVMEQCAKGVDCVMARLFSEHDSDSDRLQKDEILISLCTRLMADGGVGRLQGFNAQLRALYDMKRSIPRPDAYLEGVKLLANQCRSNMANITRKASIPDESGALARQAILSFMGDLGGLEPTETGFGRAYTEALCDPSLVYSTYVAGLCDAQLQLIGASRRAEQNEIEEFEQSLIVARRQTSMKGGSLSAPAHTKNKKGERVMVDPHVVSRAGLLGMGNVAEAKLKEAYPRHEKTLRDAAWPAFIVPEELTRQVVEPVTGHVSGTFGEMAITMSLFCGTPPDDINKNQPAGNIASPEKECQTISIGALSAAGLITAGFHSAVEVFQPMSTFTTQATHGGLGPQAVRMMEQYARALRGYADVVDTFVDKPDRWEDDAGFELTGDVLRLSKEELLERAEKEEAVATKSVDMISVLQGTGGTLATIEVSRVMAMQSNAPATVLNLRSTTTRLEELGLFGSTPELEEARRISELPPSLPQQTALHRAIERAERVISEGDKFFVSARDQGFLKQMIQALRDKFSYEQPGLKNSDSDPDSDSDLGL